MSGWSEWRKAYLTISCLRRWPYWGLHWLMVKSYSSVLTTTKRQYLVFTDHTFLLLMRNGPSPLPPTNFACFVMTKYNIGPICNFYFFFLLTPTPLPRLTLLIMVKCLFCSEIFFFFFTVIVHYTGWRREEVPWSTISDWRRSNTKEQTTRVYGIYRDFSIQRVPYRSVQLVLSHTGG